MIIEVVGKEIEKIKGDFESYLNGLNMVGEISYSQYSELYDEGTKQIQKAYELGKSELEKENAELKETLGKCAKMPVLYCLGAKETINKAKEIIKNLMVYVPVDLKEYEEAKQFLSEVEK